MLGKLSLLFLLSLFAVGCTKESGTRVTSAAKARLAAIASDTEAVDDSCGRCSRSWLTQDGLNLAKHHSGLANSTVPFTTEKVSCNANAARVETKGISRVNGISSSISAFGVFTCLKEGETGDHSWYLVKAQGDTVSSSQWMKSISTRTVGIEYGDLGGTNYLKAQDEDTFTYRRELDDGYFFDTTRIDQSWIRNSLQMAANGEVLSNESTDISEIETRHRATGSEEESWDGVYRCRFSVAEGLGRGTDEGNLYSAQADYFTGTFVNPHGTTHKHHQKNDGSFRHVSYTYSHDMPENLQGSTDDGEFKFTDSDEPGDVPSDAKGGCNR